MSAPTTKNHSWYSTKNEGPGQRGVTSNTHLYNRTMPHHTEPPADQLWHQQQQPQYNWYSQASKSTVNATQQMSSRDESGDSWNWNTDTNYYQPPSQYGQQYQQDTQQYHGTYRNPDVSSMARPNPDPWNWGWEESGISANPEPLNNNTSSNNNNNACPDPAWGWSVDGSTVYQEHNVSSANYTTNQFQPTYSTEPNNIASTANMSDIIAESFSTTSVEHGHDQTLLGSDLNSTAQLFESFKNNGNQSFSVSYVNTVEHCEKTSLENASVLSQENKDSFQSNDSSESCIKVDDDFKSVPLEKTQGKTGRDGKEEEEAVDTSGARAKSEVIRDKSIKDQDISKQSASSSLWSTESLPSSEELSQTVEGKAQSSLADAPQQDLLSVTHETEVNDYRQSYDHGSYELSSGFHNKHTEESHLKNTSSNNNVFGNQNYQNYGQESYAAIQATNEILDGKQKKESTVYPENAHLSNSTTQNESYELQTDSQSNKHSVPVTSSIDGVVNVLQTLTVSAHLKTPDVENKEIVCPETIAGSAETVSQAQVSFSRVKDITPPPTLSGTPSKNISHAQSKQNNTYSLKQVSKHNVSSPNGEGAAGGSDRRNLSYPPILPVVSSEPGMNMAQFGAMPELVSQTLQSAYSSSTLETCGKFSRKKTPALPAEDVVNLETVPDNKERPDVIEVQQNVQLDKQSATPVTRLQSTPFGQDGMRGLGTQWNQLMNYNTSPENQEVATRCGPNRDQYLETGQLIDDRESSSVPDVETVQYRTMRNGTSAMNLCLRMVPGHTDSISRQDLNIYEQENVVNLPGNEDVATPPPGLHRMIPGQVTEYENTTDISDTVAPAANNSDDVLLRRMVPGQLTEETSSITNFASEGGNVGAVPAHRSVDDIPPPGLRRMVPGESSSPESQGNAQSAMPTGTFQPIDVVPLEPRVVTGVAQDEMDGLGSTGTSQLPSSPLSTNSQLKEPLSPLPEVSQSSNNLQQPPSERSETIGSDNVEAYTPLPAENISRDTNSRRENSVKDRERHIRDEDSNKASPQQQSRNTEGRNYYEKDRDRDRADSPGGRYRERDDWDRKYDSMYERDRDRARDRDDSSSGGRYRDDRDHRHYEMRKEYRDHDSRRPRRKTRYERQDDDADTEDYFSDHEHDKARYRENYDSRYTDRTDRPQREMDKTTRDRKDLRSTGRDRDRDRNHDRDRAKKRHEYSERHSYRHGDDGYGREYEDEHYFKDNQRSRPSSRTDYSGYRRKEYAGYSGYNYYDRHMEAYPYDPYYTYQYYDNLRRTNPAAYAAWYTKYYSSHAAYNHGTFSEDRGSVHSGRSSANEELNKDRVLEETRSSIVEEAATTPQRLTPAKFSTAHIKGIITSRGQVIKIQPHYPLDGQPAVVEIHDIQALICPDDAVKDIIDYPGPLVRGVTHKNSVINFCTRKLKKAERDLDLLDRESLALLWRLLILLLRQNGTVVGADIAELLLSNSSNVQETNSAISLARSAPSPAASYHSSNHDAQLDESLSYAVSNKSEIDTTFEFRQYLLYGNKKEALEWAMKHGLWGHALFLASKMDQRTYAHIMTRFANGLAMNDPLQTLYQLMSGRQPAAVTCCADEKWGDWKPHLAMILSNPSQKPDLDRKTVITLGDTLGARGCLYGAHFCYLVAQVGFGTFSNKTSKIVLLGSSHYRSFMEFATTEAIQMTEIYIYSLQLATNDFNIPEFQAYKLLYAKKLSELGMPAEAIHYVEVIAETIQQGPSYYDISFIKQVYELGDQLKYHDPICNSGEGEDVNLSDPAWLSGVRNVIHNYNMGLIQQDIPSYSPTSNLSCSEGEPVHHGTNTDLPQDPLSAGWHQQQEQQQHALYFQDQQTLQHWSGQQSIQQKVEGSDDTGCQKAETSLNASSLNPDQCWTTSSQWGSGSSVQTAILPEQNDSSHQIHHQDIDYNNSTAGTECLGGSVPPAQQPFNYWDLSASHTEDAPRVTLPGTLSETSQQQPSTVQEQQQVSQPKPTITTNKSSVKKKPKDETLKAAGSTRSWWIGGIWDKLALRPKNQMKLPDDKNPSIVWDPDKKKWTNVEEDDDEGSSDLPPPPKASELPKTSENLSAGADDNMTRSPPSSNMYKLSGPGKGRKPKYVDVLGGNKTTNLNVTATDLFPTVMPSQPQNYFIPAPVERNDNAPTDFLTASVTATSNAQDLSTEQPHLSRWSSTSSLSREVQKYTMRGQQNKIDQSGAAYPAAPMMFDPASFTESTGYSRISSNRRQYPN
ncbi:protein transport protein Sec16A-like isoform X2 [Periplaneta americana]|uniref:protein transport protein Sec16A-like isoform X2 n=1 Tax=Periplaneta americana TaxID=6978 RepID=UPI0037E7B102